MTGRREKRSALDVGRLFSALLGLLCAVVLSVVFYGAMVYQLGEDAGRKGAEDVQGTPAPLSAALNAAQQYPGETLALSGMQAGEETVRDIAVDGQTCRVVSRVYVLSGGGQAELISAYPAAYLGRLSKEGWQAQLISGFSLAGLDAAYMTRGDRGLLAARDGENVYLLISAADEAALYALGASAYLE